MIDPAFLFLALLAWHAIADRPLQPAALSRAKRAGGSDRLGSGWALLIHGGVHGAGVSAVMVAGGYGGFWWLGFAEAATHAEIDRAKVLGKIGTVEDQALHFFWQVIWVAFAVGGGQ